MEIILAKSAGFCFGVKRAVDYAYSKAGTGEIYTYGPIIHNKEVTGDLDKKGVHVTENLDDIKDGEVIIRSHGVPPDVYKALEDRGIRYTDCTCPFVKKIHNIVHENHNKGKSIIIVGNKDHPEIIGINGWCDNSALIINSVEEAQETVLSDDKEYALVVQTTFQTDVFDEIIDILKEKREDIDVYRTICSATGDRQAEAVEIAKSVDVMIVLGDKSSSNTRKLYDICKKYCKNVYLCERICDLQLQNVKKDVKIGITAGASTPSMIIKEAVKTMNDAESKTFEEMIDDSMVTLKTGQIVKGKVISISDSGEVAVDLGYKSDGIITRSEFSNDENDDPAETLKPGDEIDVYVIRVNDGDGNVQLSKRRAEMDKTYDAIEEAHNNGATIKAKITSQIKGGLIAYSNGARVFIPSSQISNRYVEDLSVYVGQELDFEILEFDKSKRRVVVGRKALVQREIDAKRAELFASIKVGDRLNGKVSRIVDFGAFVDLGGVDGLIHISELSWGRVKKVTDVLSVGDDVVVTVLDVKPEKGKISLSLKDLDADPWKTAAEKYPVGSIVTGKVVRMVSFGAFVELEEGVDGLVHISQIAYKHVENPSDELEVGQEVQAKVTEINVENKKLSLSIKETLERPARPIKEPRILEPTPAQEEKAEEKPEEAAAAAEEPEKEIPVTEAAADEAPAEETAVAEAEEVSVSEEAAAAEESEETPAAEAEEAVEAEAEEAPEEAEETPEEEAEEIPAAEEAPAEVESVEAPAEEETSEDEE